MKKDVIYIDTEDDITSIIEKVKNADAKIVALVPPKRVGVLQSAVNLKLLQKAAQSVGHRVVLITSDQSLTSLASGVGIPIAKNLQTKPELAPIAALEVDDEDIINGEELPVGELAKTGDTLQSSPSNDAALTGAAAASAASLDRTPNTPSSSVASKATKSLAAAGAGFKGKIPNFESFRKRLFLIGGGAALLVIFLIWAIFVAPHATVTVTAKTTGVSINKDIILDPALTASDPATAKIKPALQQLKKSASTEFDASGTKDIGNKATGTLTLTNSHTSQAITVPAGTTFVAQGKQFTNNTTVTVPGVYLCKVGNTFAACNGNVDVGITARDIGPEYNIGPQEFDTNAPVDAAKSAQATGGGSKETITVVSQADIDKAKASLAQQDADAVREELKKQFTGDVIVVNESYGNTQAAPAVVPALGEQAKRAKLTVDTTYTLIAVPRADIKQLLDANLQESLQGKENQRIYASGDLSLRFSNYQAGPNGTFITKLNTVGSIGPNIDGDKLAVQIKGKRFGEIEQIVNGYDGVENVQVQFSPFWVTSAPGPDKTDIKFKITNGSQ
jgi:hypothetical protein